MLQHFATCHNKVANSAGHVVLNNVAIVWPGLKVHKKTVIVSPMQKRDCFVKFQSGSRFMVV